VQVDKRTIAVLHELPEQRFVDALVALLAVVLAVVTHITQKPNDAPHRYLDLFFGDKTRTHLRLRESIN
jgi:hypothetical protein